MPSDERVQPDERLQRALDAMVRGRETFRTAVAEALEQIRGHLAAHATRADDRAALAAAELGAFAGGRIDGSRFAALTTDGRVLDDDAAATMRRCADVLAELVAAGDAPFACEVAPGDDLRRVVDGALADAGRAFGAVLVFQALRTGVYRSEQHEPLLRAFPFARWNRGERLLAPPLVIVVNGADLRADALAEYLDGRQKLVLLVRGACTPAPLVRMVTPGIFVLQAAAETELAGLAAFDGPGVAALVPEPVARFAHDPLGADTGGRRLTVTHLPAEAPRAAVGGWSVWQQREELAQLAALELLLTTQAATLATPDSPTPSAPTPAAAAPATPPVVTPPAVTAPVAAVGGAGAPAARGDELAVTVLADWLLAQAGLAAGPPPTEGAGAAT